MTIADVKQILTTRFDSEEDRAYWIAKLAELESKEITNEENSRYFRQNRKYDR